MACDIRFTGNGLISWYQSNIMLKQIIADATRAVVRDGLITPS